MPAHPGPSGVAAITPLGAPPATTVTPPGSKSITNRALLCAALAPGVSRLRGVLRAEDTEAMLAAVRALGATVRALPAPGPAPTDLEVSGVDPRHRVGEVRIDARQSGTTSRFVLPVLALAPGRGVVDGAAQLRARPFGPLLAALAGVGADVEELGEPGRLPVAVSGPARGGTVELPGHLSSQFLSGLLLAGPLFPAGVRVRLTTPLVSVPYVRMTEKVMAAFGVECADLAVDPSGYRPADYHVEPDASAASYFFAAAAITAGRVRVEGLGADSLQGDLAFVDVLEAMGATVQRTPGAVTVTGPARLRGVDVDLADLSDMAQTLAAVAVFAETPTRVRGIGFIRRKETDRIAAVVGELRRAGIDASEHDDGFTVRPGRPRPTRFATYDDHRMAMSFALLGLRCPGIEIADPGCVAKTYPGYFADLADLAHPRA